MYNRIDYGAKHELKTLVAVAEGQIQIATGIISGEVPVYKFYVFELTLLSWQCNLFFQNCYFSVFKKVLANK